MVLHPLKELHDAKPFSAHPKLLQQNIPFKFSIPNLQVKFKVQKRTSKNHRHTSLQGEDEL